MSGFIFGGDTGVGDPAELRRRRDMVDQLLQSSMTRAPQTFGEGLAAIGQALAGRISDKRIREQEEATRERARGQFSQITGQLMGSPSQQAMAAGGGPTRAAANEVEIIEGLVARGLPQHVAQGFVKNFRDESGLRTDINEVAPLVPGSRGGFGLAQWTGPRRVALERFAQSRGVDPSDMNVQLDFLMTELQGPEARAGQAIMAAPDAPTAADAILRQFLRPAAEHVETRSQRYLGGGGSAMPSADMVAQLSELAANPYLPEGQRAVVQSMLQTQMQGMDPMRQMQMEQMRLQIEQMQNPQPNIPDTVRALEMRAEAAGLVRGTPEYQQFMLTGGKDGPLVDMSGMQIGGGPLDRFLYGSDGGVPPGWRVDRETGEASRIPGGPADVEAQDAATKTAETDRQQSLKLGGTLELINLNIAQAESGGLPVTGPIGAARRTWLGQALTGSDAVDVQNRTAAITDGAAFAEIQNMRDNSPTGGAVGQLTDAERTAIGNSVTALNTATSQEEYVRAAKVYRDLALNMAYGEGNWRLDPETGDVTLTASEGDAPAADVPPMPEGAVTPEAIMQLDAAGLAAVDLSTAPIEVIEAWIARQSEVGQ